MTAAMGVGAVVGGLFVAGPGQDRPAAAGHRRCAGSRCVILATFAPTLAVELIALALAAAASISFMSTGNSTLQLDADAGDARPGHVAVVRGLPGLDPDRRPASSA